MPLNAIHENGKTTSTGLEKVWAKFQESGKALLEGLMNFEALDLI